MKTRGEQQYINMPSFGAGLYDNLTSVRGVSRLFEDIARTVADVLQEGRLLDIGTGPGRLLAEFNRQIPKLELFGLDISASMLKVAAKNLEHVANVDLKLGNIVHTDYQDDFFDCMVSSGSFYNWDKPVEGLNEVYRILKPGRKAFMGQKSGSAARLFGWNRAATARRASSALGARPCSSYPPARMSGQTSSGTCGAWRPGSY
jgi:ubiquinone/menaquinone biosynthesis C-methylase UbiE